jgi:DNA polymerase elongation subunit (family B)
MRSLFEDDPASALAPPQPGAAPPGARPEPVGGPIAAAVELDPLLGGRGQTTRIVGVEVGDRAAVLLRSVAGRILREERPFRPWLLSVEQRDAPGAVWRQLEGPGHRWRAEFADWRAFETAREQLRAGGVSLVAYAAPVKQYLLASGETLFKGMAFDEVRRLQFDLETTTLDPERPDARILLAAFTDNRGGSWVAAGDDERALLRELVARVQEIDPDVIEGHNLFSFDLPYLATRAERLGVTLPLGRDSSPLRIGRERNCPVGPLQLAYRSARIWGRHCIDTLLAVQRFDLGRGELESYGLKECARIYGLAEPDRVLLDRARMSDLWDTDPALVRRYALQDVHETRRLAELVTPTEFYQTQMVPDSYQNVATTGTGEKVNALLVRAYLDRGVAVPQSQPPREYPGGYTEVRRTGVLRRVVKADVESLYPSIMLEERIAPASDRLQVFLPMLRQLTERRLKAKSAMQGASGAVRQYWNGLQSSFKLLINSFYGYVGGPFYFNDYDAAQRVTLTGQRLAKQIAELLESSGSAVIEIDTDGVYFVPPAGIEGETAEAQYVERIATQLPPGFRLAFDGRYAAMLSLKIKNYVLVDYDGRKTFKGGSLRSRADERFGREFIARAVDCLIAGDREGLGRAYERLADQLANGEVPVEQLARRERVTAKTLSSEAKKRSKLAAGELRVGESMLLYRRADGTLARIEEYAGDEDRWHYVEKLRKFAGRFEEAIGDDFDRLCPRISKQRIDAKIAGQPTLFELE